MLSCGAKRIIKIIFHWNWQVARQTIKTPRQASLISQPAHSRARADKESRKSASQESSTFCLGARRMTTDPVSLGTNVCPIEPQTYTIMTRQSKKMKKKPQKPVDKVCPDWALPTNATHLGQPQLQQGQQHTHTCAIERIRLRSGVWEGGPSFFFRSYVLWKLFSFRLHLISARQTSLPICVVIKFARVVRSRKNSLNIFVFRL